MRGDVTNRICEYMNSMSEKKFSKYHISVIRECISLELLDRKHNCIKIDSHSNRGKYEIYERISNIAKNNFNAELDPEDIKLFKKCRLIEFQDRTGKCAWGISYVRKFYGYDINTGKELGGD